MTDQRVTINTQGQPVYTSGIGRLPSAEYGVNSGLSGKVNTNVGGAILNSNANLGTGVVTTVPYGAAGNSGAYVVPNTGIVGRGTQEIRQTVTSTGPNYAYQQKYKQSRGPNSGTYERKIVETKPAYTNNPPLATPPPNYGTTSAYVRPVSNSVAAPMIGTTVAAASTPVITRNTYDHQPPVYVQSAPAESHRCPKPLLALLGLLALAGIILGLLFGLGAIGGRNMVTPPTSTNNNSTTNGTVTTTNPVVVTPVINESPTLPNTISIETSVINSTKPSGIVSSNTTNTAAVTAPQTTSTTTVTTTTKTEGSTISTVIPSTSVSSTSTNTTPITSVSKPNLTFDSDKAQTIDYMSTSSTSTTPTTTVTKTTSTPTTTVSSSQTSTSFSIPSIQPISVAPIKVQPVTA